MLSRALAVGHREARVLDIRLDDRGVDRGERRAAEALAHEELRAGDVIGRERCVGRAVFHRDRAAVEIDRVAPVAVAAADAPDIADVVAQQRHHEMQPVMRRDPALADVLAAQDLLADQRHHDRVVDVVIGRLAVGDVLERNAADEGEDAGIARLEQAVDALIRRLQPLDEGFDHELCRVEHRWLPFSRRGVSHGPRRRSQ